MMMPPSTKVGLSVTLAGTVAMLASLLDNCATGLLAKVALTGGMDTNPESLLPPTTLGTLNVSESPDAADGCTVSSTLCDDVPAFAVITEHPAAPLTARAVNVALEPDIPFDVVTEGGTVATDGVPLVSETSATQLLHNPLMVTVPVTLLPAGTDDDASLTEATAAALTATTAATGAATSSRRTVVCIRLPESLRVPFVPLNMISLRSLFNRNEANRAFFSL